jgi:cell wall-associated NlpC family hydrolase
MPVLNPPDVPGSAYPGAATKPAVTQDQIDKMVSWALSQVGKGYSEGAGVRCGPDKYDCSGFVYTACKQAGIRPPGGIQSSCTTTFTQWPDRNSNGNTEVQPPFAKGVLIYFNTSSGAQPGHTAISLGDGTMVNALDTQYGIITCPQSWGGTPMGGISLVGAGSTGGAGSDTGGGSGSGSGSGNAQSTTGKTWQDEVAAQQAIVAKLPDPRDNLPFSKYFQTMRMPPANNLVRGGIADLTTRQFKCYFMMNPQQISMGSNIDTSNLTSPLQQDPSVMQYGGYWVTNQTVSFTIYFNRMYEVWQGGVKGPSDIGCRWDIRAIERLMGIFDAQTKGGASVGIGNYGAGGYPPMTYPLQVVFGGSNSYQFQGTIAGMDYTYTLFSKDMIPIEAFCDLQIMRIYQPSMSTPDLVNGTFMTAAKASQYAANPAANASKFANTPFNLPKKGTAKKK